MSTPVLPTHTAEVFTEIRHERPKRFSRSISIHIVNLILGLLAVAGCVLLAIFIGSLLGRWIESATKDQPTPTTLAISIATSHVATKTRFINYNFTMSSVVAQVVIATQVISVTRTVEVSAWQTTAFVTIVVPESIGKCAGGGFSHPECQKT